MTVKRSIEKKVLELAKQYPAITITGPRQSGKTTLVKNLFPEKPYISIEIKSGETITDSYFKNLNYYQKINPTQVEEKILIYAGDHSYQEKNCMIKNYKDIFQPEIQSANNL